MLEFRDWKPCLDTLPFVSSLHMNVTNGRMKELHSTTWPNYHADIWQMGDYSTKCHTPEDVKKKLFSHLSVCTLPFDSLPYDCAPHTPLSPPSRTTVSHSCCFPWHDKHGIRHMLMICCRRRRHNSMLSWAHSMGAKATRAHWVRAEDWITPKLFPYAVRDMFPIGVLCTPKEVQYFHQFLWVFATTHLRV